MLHRNSAFLPKKAGFPPILPVLPHGLLMVNEF
jgi:hypothetical protein